MENSRNIPTPRMPEMMPEMPTPNMGNMPAMGQMEMTDPNYDSAAAFAPFRPWFHPGFCPGCGRPFCWGCRRFF